MLFRFRLLRVKPVGTEIVDKVRDLIKEQHLHYLSVRYIDGQVLARFPDTDDQLKASDYIKAALGEDYIVAPNLAPRTPKWLQAIGANPLKWGSICAVVCIFYSLLMWMKAQKPEKMARFILSQMIYAKKYSLLSHQA